jgi:hypothetical protein
MQQTNVRKRIFPKLKTKRTLLILGFSGLFYSPKINAHPLDFLFPKSDFEHYMQTPLRQKLLDTLNNGMDNPRPHDASNWTGCRVGKGTLVGTFRDISACAASACYQREVTVDELANFTYDQAKGVIRWIWDGIDATELPDQKIADLYMHIQMHYGNLKVVEKALRKMGYEVWLDGRMKNYEFESFLDASKKQPYRTFNEIRTCLADAYAGDNPKFRRGFLKFLDEEFPERTIFSERLEASLWLALRTTAYNIYEHYIDWSKGFDENGLAMN